MQMYDLPSAERGRNRGVPFGRLSLLFFSHLCKSSFNFLVGFFFSTRGMHDANRKKAGYKRVVKVEQEEYLIER
jgi:hypothetical protein